MSIEQAITDYAAAIRELAAAIRLTTSAGGNGFSTADQLKYDQEQESLAVAKEAELEKAVTKVETEAKTEKQSAAKQAIADALEKAKKEKETATQNAQSQGAGQGSDDLLGDGGAAVELDYEKDVEPLLVKVGKDKQQLVDLLGKFNAKNGAGIAKADYPAVVAAANKIIGG